MLIVGDDVYSKHMSGEQQTGMPNQRKSTARYLYRFYAMSGISRLGGRNIATLLQAIAFLGWHRFLRTGLLLARQRIGRLSLLFLGNGLYLHIVKQRLGDF